VPFTPVPGSRLLADSDEHRDMLLQALVSWCADEKLSSLHLLFGSAADIAATTRAELLHRQTVQFHWQNLGWTDFDAFLGSLNQEKRKKIARKDAK
jgi:predicted N-acyltransferase